MMNTQKKIILAFALTISLVTLAGTVQPQIFAEETDEKQFTYGNNITIHTVFDFYEGVEESDGFQVFTQLTGFDASTATFKLEGIVDNGIEYLYEEVTNAHGKAGVTTNTGLFHVDVYLNNGDETLRHFKYSKCEISDYKVTTLTDKVESWTSDKGFALIDEFEFLCLGYTMYNPMNGSMKTAESSEDIESTSDLPE